MSKYKNDEKWVGHTKIANNANEWGRGSIQVFICKDFIQKVQN